MRQIQFFTLDESLRIGAQQPEASSSSGAAASGTPSTSSNFLAPGNPLLASTPPATWAGINFTKHYLGRKTFNPQILVKFHFNFTIYNSFLIIIGL
jgi:hypothetical protein